MGYERHTARWHVLEDPATVALEAARRITRAAAVAVSERGVFRIVLAGGSTPARAYRLLAEGPADWDRWEVYFGDERCLPSNDRDRNSVMASENWLARVPIPASHVHPIAAELGAESAAKLYQPVVSAALPFDMVLLGMGEDGHTASLFPGHQHVEDELVHAVHGAPKPPPDRVTLSASALGRARHILALVTGSGKEQAIRAWRSGEPLPIASLPSTTPMEVLTDQAVEI